MTQHNSAVTADVSVTPTLILWVLGLKIALLPLETVSKIPGRPPQKSFKK